MRNTFLILLAFVLLSCNEEDPGPELPFIPQELQFELSQASVNNVYYLYPTDCTAYEYLDDRMRTIYFLSDPLPCDDAINDDGDIVFIYQDLITDGNVWFTPVQISTQRQSQVLIREDLYVDLAAAYPTGPNPLTDYMNNDFENRFFCDTLQCNNCPDNSIIAPN